MFRTLPAFLYSSKHTFLLRTMAAGALQVTKLPCTISALTTRQSLMPSPTTLPSTHHQHTHQLNKGSCDVPRKQSKLSSLTSIHMGDCLCKGLHPLYLSKCKVQVFCSALELLLPTQLPGRDAQTRRGATAVWSTVHLTTQGGRWRGASSGLAT